jgi:hypothetical protein
VATVGVSAGTPATTLEDEMGSKRKWIETALSQQLPTLSENLLVHWVEGDMGHVYRVTADIRRILNTIEDQCKQDLWEGLNN